MNNRSSISFEFLQKKQKVSSICILTEIYLYSIIIRMFLFGDGMSGLFITFEGVECSGKSLQSKRLLEFCHTNKIPAILVREPGSTEVGEQLRNILLSQYCTPLAEFFILSASRTQLTEMIIKPKLSENYIVISDRYFHSSLAYQGYGRDLDVTQLKQISQIATLGLQPTTTFFLCPSYQIAQERLKQKKGLDRIELEKSDFHKKIYDGYLDLSTKYNYINTLDGDLDLEVLHQQILTILQQYDSRFSPSNI